MNLKDIARKTPFKNEYSILSRIGKNDVSSLPNRDSSISGESAPLVNILNYEPDNPEVVEEKRVVKEKIVNKFLAQNHAKQLLPYQKRLQSCFSIPFESVVQVWRSEQRKTASYRKLMVCSSVWQCPVCAARISAKRATEIKKAVEECRKKGGHVYMLTLTHSHSREDSLKSLINKQSKALQTMWRSGGFRRFLKTIGYQGRISSFEATWGKETGWHPHRHILLFFKQELFQEDYSILATSIYTGWRDACKKNKLKVNLQYAVHITSCNENVDSYVTKLHLEMALSDFKKGKKTGRRSAYALLYDSMAGDKEAGRRFQEFALTMKGKVQMMWSRGLKKLYNIDEKTDEQIMEEKAEQDEKHYLDILAEVWKGVARDKKRGELLYHVGQGNKDHINKLLIKYGRSYFFVDSC